MWSASRSARYMVATLFLYYKIPWMWDCAEKELALDNFTDIFFLFGFTSVFEWELSLLVLLGPGIACCEVLQFIGVEWTVCCEFTTIVCAEEFYKEVVLSVSLCCQEKHQGQMEM